MCRIAHRHWSSEVCRLRCAHGPPARPGAEQSHSGGSGAGAPIPRERSLAMHGVPFAYVAESVAHRAADLLAADVMVVDEHDVMVARATPSGSESFDVINEA